MVRLVRSAARRCSACTTASLRAASRASRACASLSGGGSRDGGGGGGRTSVAVRARGAAASASYCRLGCAPPPLSEATVAKVEPLRNRWRRAAAAMRPSVGSSAAGSRCTMAAVW